MASEQQIQKKIFDYLIEVGAYAFKVIEANRVGVADIAACINGSYIALEVKTPSGVVSAIQRAHIDLVKDAGGFAYIVRSFEEAKQIIDDIANIPQVEFEI
jgi:predicted RecB family endonuclease